MNVVEFDGEIYPEFQTKGNAAQFAMPFAKQMLSGIGIDVGCNRYEWAFPGALPVDLTFDDEYDAYHLPDTQFDYVFSSHCLEHLPDWVGALNYWTDHLKVGGTMFLYLPHYAQKYWRPWNCRKHVTSFVPQMLRDYYENKPFKNIVVTEGYDLNHSFYAVATKC